MAPSSSSTTAPTEEDLGGSSSSEVAPNPSASASASDTSDSTSAAIQPEIITTKTSSAVAIAKEDLIELIRAVKFKNSEFSQRQVYQEIVTEIPTKFPQYAESLNPSTICLNDVKKAWKKAILQQQQPTKYSINNSNNNDLAERLRTMTTTPEVYTVGLNNNNSNTADSLSTSSIMARDYVARFLEEQHAESSAQQRQLLEDYVHVFLNVPADSSVTKKPHQALINFQNKTTKVSANKKQKGHAKKKKGTTTATATTTNVTPPPFENAIVVKLQMAAPIDANDTVKHPMLLYNQTRTVKTFVHPDGTLTGSPDASVASGNTHESENKSKSDDDDGYYRLAHWIRTSGVGGALGAAGGTKAYFYGRLTEAGAKTNPILSIYVKSLAPSDAQDW